jgi:hypothetical protein
MSATIISHSVDTDRSAVSASSTSRRLLTAAAAAAAAAAIWGIATASGMSLHHPVSGSGAAPKLAIGLVIAAPVIAAFAGWGVSALLERFAPRAWWAVASIVLLLSLAAPLTGHGVSAGNRLVLVCMHLAVGAIVGFGMRPRRVR